MSVDASRIMYNLLGAEYSHARVLQLTVCITTNLTHFIQSSKQPGMQPNNRSKILAQVCASIVYTRRLLADNVNNDWSTHTKTQYNQAATHTAEQPRWERQRCTIPKCMVVCTHNQTDRNRLDRHRVRVHAKMRW